MTATPGRTRKYGWIAGLIAAGLMHAGLSGCTVNPATGEQSFTAFMSPEQEIQVGREEHPKIMKEFGGAYVGDRVGEELGAWVAQIGARLARHSELPPEHFTFTVLDDPLVNAFALPGGYIYVTRGLIALCNNEAELAGVIAHEIGHVTARHSAQRYSQQVAMSLGVGLLGAVTGQRAVADLGSIVGSLYLQGYSRDQEFEADTLGLRYMAAAGYDPDAVASFLARMGRHTALQMNMTGRDYDPEAMDIMATHPRTVDRVKNAQAAANVFPDANAIVGRDSFLRRVDGMLYGDNPEQGFVKGRDFEHPILKFRFRVPEGFTIQNSSEQVAAFTPDRAAIIRFDGDRANGWRNMADYLVQKWGRGTVLQQLDRFTVNGMDAATGLTRIYPQGESVDMRLVAIRFDQKRIYRFMFLTRPELTGKISEDFRRTTHSFMKMSDEEARALKPWRIDIVRGSGQSIDTMARRMPDGPKQTERFRVLNGIPDNDNRVTTRKVKIVRAGR